MGDPTSAPTDRDYVTLYDGDHVRLLAWRTDYGANLMFSLRAPNGEWASTEVPATCRQMDRLAEWWQQQKAAPSGQQQSSK